MKGKHEEVLRLRGGGKFRFDSIVYIGINVSRGYFPLYFLYIGFYQFSRNYSTEMCVVLFDLMLQEELGVVSMCD